MTQTASAFGQVQGALSFFIENYTYLAELRAVMDRLKGLQEASDAKPDTAIEVAPEAGRHRCRARRPDARPAQRAGAAADATLVLPRGRSTLITGASGSGKSTLFRALAGIWPFGNGQVRVPAGARVLFLPQKPYIPIGTLRDAVKYPDEQSTATDAEIVAALEAAQLGQLAGRLDEARTGPTSCRAASSSGWPWRAPWCSSPTGCSSTRPRPRWTTRPKPRSMAR